MSEETPAGPEAFSGGPLTPPPPRSTLPSMGVVGALIAVAGLGYLSVTNGFLLIGVVVWVFGGIGGLVMLQTDRRDQLRRPKQDPVADFVQAQLSDVAQRSGTNLSRHHGGDRLCWMLGDTPIWADVVPFDGGWLDAAERGLADGSDLLAVAGQRELAAGHCEIAPALIRLTAELSVPFAFHAARFDRPRFETGDSLFDNAVSATGEPLALVAFLDDNRRALIEREVRGERLDGRHLTVKVAMKQPDLAARIVEIFVSMIDRLQAPWSPHIAHAADVIEATSSPLVRRRAFAVLAQHAAHAERTLTVAAKLADGNDPVLAELAAELLARTE